MKRISYNSTHVPEFKKYIAWLGLFSVGVVLIAIYQLFLLIKAHNNTVELSTLEMLAGVGCLVISVAFLLLMIGEIIRFIIFIKRIKLNGFVDTKTFIFNYSSKLSFGNLFRLFEYIVLTVTVVFVIGLTTYSVLNYAYYTIINYYLPISLMLLLSAFYATKMLELKYEVEK